MAAPTLLTLDGAVADSTHIMGALVVTFSVIAFAESSRLVRWFNVLFGVWMLLAAWLLVGGTPVWPWISVVSGLVLIALNLRRGRVEDSYGEWQRFIQ
jgi:O-antigen ligase